MNRSIAVTAVAMLFAGLASLAAEEPPYRDFVRGLRDMHYADLALEYLQELSNKPLPPDVAAILPLEMARTRLAQAEDMPTAGQRLVLYAQARQDFATFLKKHQRPDLAAEAAFDLARLLRLQARTQLTLALQQETPEAQQAQKRQARARFAEAAKALEQAQGQIAAQLAKYGQPQSPAEKAQKRALEEAKLQAQFEHGLALVEELKTFDDLGLDMAQRGDVAQKAEAILKDVADATNPLCWQARAWLGRCYVETDDPRKARTEFANIIKETGPEVEKAKRLAKYFQLLVLENDPEITHKDPLREVIRAGQRWLETYRGYQNTPEGCGVRFVVAEAYRRQALQLAKGKSLFTGGRELLAKAEKLYAGLERTENDYTQQARLRKLNIIIVLFQERSKGHIDKLKDFQECYLRAELELAELNQEAKEFSKTTETDAGKLKDLEKKLQGQQQQHYQNMAAALRRGLDLADTQTEPADRLQARLLLAYAYLSLNRFYEAAVAAEDQARSEPTASSAAGAAIVALQAYAQILGQEERGEKREQVLETDRARMRRLDLYVQKTWPNDPAADLARHQLGSMALQKKNYLQAIDYLSQIRPSYNEFTFSQFDLSTAALQAEKDKLPLVPGRPSFRQLASAALQKIPDLSNNADAVTAEYYFYAKLRLCELLLENKQYKELQAVTSHLAKRFADVRLPQKARDELQRQIATWRLYGQYGLAEVALQAGRFAEVKKLTDPFVEQVKANQLADLKDPRLITGMLSLSLRAHVQTGDTKQAQDILKLLQTKGGGDLAGGAAGVLLGLVDQLKKQIDELRKKGAPAEAQREKIEANYAAFLDELARQPAKTLTPDIIHFLAFSYAGLGKHARAAELLASIPKPQASTNPNKEKRQSEDQEKEAFYHSVRLLYCRELRLSRQFSLADKVLRDIHATPLGKRSLDARKETILLLEDQEQYGAAAQKWNQLMKDLRPRFNDNRIKHQYFECYYHLMYCMYQHALNRTDQAKKQAGIKQAARWIINLESKLPNMGGDDLKKLYLNLLEKEPLLREQYERLGGTMVKNGSP